MAMPLPGILKRYFGKRSYIAYSKNYPTCSCRIACFVERWSRVAVCLVMKSHSASCLSTYRQVISSVCFIRLMQIESRFG